MRSSSGTFMMKRLAKSSSISDGIAWFFDVDVIVVVVVDVVVDVVVAVAAAAAAADADADVDDDAADADPADVNDKSNDCAAVAVAGIIDVDGATA